MKKAPPSRKIVEKATKTVLACVILILLVSLSGCSQPERTPKMGEHTPDGVWSTSTPKQTTVYNTPIPPQDIVKRFLTYYNQRNSTLLYSLFSDRVKANYAFEDVEKQLEIAENHSIKIIGWEFSESLLSPELRIVEANLTMKIDGNIVNVTVDFPVIYVRYEINRSTYRVIGFNESIDSWPFDEIHSIRCEKDSKLKPIHHRTE